MCAIIPETVLIYPVVSFLLSYVFYILRIILPFHQDILRNFTNKKMDISKIIHDRSTPCIANQIRIRIFINDGYQVVFCISAVTRDDDMIFAVKFRHNLPDYGGCLSVFFRCIMFLPYRFTFLCNILCQIHYTSESPVRYFFMKKL